MTIIRAVILALVIVITVRGLRIRGQNTALDSGIATRQEIRLLNEIEQRGSIFVYDSGRYQYIFPEMVQAEIGERLSITVIAGNAQTSVTEKIGNKKRLIVESYSSSRDHLSSGILYFSKIRGFLAQTRGILANILFFQLPASHSGIAAGIIFGQDPQLHDTTKEELRKVGLLHVVAASGYNVHIVAGLCDRFFKFLSRRKRLIIQLICMWFYAGLAGFSVSIVRATCMVSAAMIASRLGREYNGAWVLFLTALAMLCIDPALISSISFQLSVAASYGIIAIFPLFIKQSDKLLYGSEIGYFKESFFISIAVSMTTFPILIWSFESVSLVSLFSNMFLLWLIPAMMCLSLIQIVLSILFYPLAKLVQPLTWVVFEFWLNAVHLLSEVPFSEVPIERKYAVIPAILGLFGYFWLKKRSQNIL